MPAEESASASGVAPGDADPVQRAIDGAAPAVREGMQRLRAAVLAEVPDAEPVVSYRVPAWRDPASGKVVCGFASTRDGWSLYPFSGNAVASLAGRLVGWVTTKGSIHVTAARPLPDDLLAELVRFRVREIAERGR